MNLRPTYRQAEATRYLRPGGAWDVPTLDQLLSSRRPPSGPAIVDGEARLDAAALERVVAALSGGLRSLGVRRGSVVTWQLPNWWEAIALFRACWRCGAVAAPIHHQVGPTEVGRMVESLRPTASFAAPGMPLAERQGTIGVRGANGRLGELLACHPVATGAGRGADVAVVLFTSGSTGHPKAVLHTNRGLAYKARSMVRAHALSSADVALMPSPLAHVSGLLNAVLVPGAAAMNVVLMERWDPEAGVRLAGEHSVSFMIGPPTLFLDMMDVAGPPARLSSLRVVSCGGMGVTPEFIDAARRGLGATVKRTYGSTEAPTVTTSTAADGPDKARDTDGRSVGDAVIRVVDPLSNRSVPPGEQGEVLLRGPELFVGYGEASETAEAVRRGWFATGDLGTLDADGWLTIVGRCKDVIIRAGENIASAEVERLLEAYPGVRQAVVVGCPDERLGERVAAFVVGDGRLDVQECRQWFSAQGVARFKTPELVVHVDEIPLLGIGKPDRSALKARAAQLAGVGR
ncbi:MAG TPA: AMP-binding protein [Acidimicrobiales bacterium]|nr:AMP-binding protein [Acidimicrobiales bacterium]